MKTEPIGGVTLKMALARRQSTPSAVAVPWAKNSDLPARRNSAVPSTHDPSLAGAEYYDEDDFEYMRRMVPIANARGVKFVPGDDYGFFDMAPHGAYSGELACYVEQVGISPLDVIFKPVTMRGFFLGHPEFAAKLAPAVVQAAEMIASGRLHIPVAGTYPLSSIKEAITHAQRGGKILLDIAGSSTRPRNRHLNYEAT